MDHSCDTHTYEGGFSRSQPQLHQSLRNTQADNIAEEECYLNECFEFVQPLEIIDSTLNSSANVESNCALQRNLCAQQGLNPALFEGIKFFLPPHEEYNNTSIPLSKSGHGPISQSIDPTNLPQSDFACLCCSHYQRMQEMEPCPEHPLTQNQHNTETIGSRALSGRKSRSHIWPRLSSPPPVIDRPIMFETRTIGHSGKSSGRNLLALIDGVARTQYNIRIMRGRELTYLPHVQHYPRCTVDIPGGLTLDEICQYFPRHVWGTGLRMFIAEGWTGERIYNALPEDFRDSKALTRPWNYIQQGFTREVRRMNEEDGIVVAPGQRRKRSVSAGADFEWFDGMEFEPIILTERHAPENTAFSKSRPSEIPMSSYDATTTTISHQPTIREAQNNTIRSYPIDHCERNNRMAEFATQEELFLALLHACCPNLADESYETKLARVKYARINICRVYGVDVDHMSSESLASLTKRLREAVAVLVPHSVRPNENDIWSDDQAMDSTTDIEIASHWMLEQLQTSVGDTMNFP